VCVSDQAELNNVLLDTVISEFVCQLINDTTAERKYTQTHRKLL